MTQIVIDAANVIGSRPDGWWRDRAGAARRLADGLAAVLAADPAGLLDAVGADRGPASVTLVLEGAAKAGAPTGGEPPLRVVHAEADGDSAIVDVVRQLVADGSAPVVVTADRGLRERVSAAGGRSVGPARLRTLLDP